jgi:hypothetical protein
MLIGTELSITGACIKALSWRLTVAKVVAVELESVNIIVILAK